MAGSFVGHKLTANTSIDKMIVKFFGNGGMG